MLRIEHLSRRIGRDATSPRPMCSCLREDGRGAAALLKWRGELGSEDIGSLVFLAPTWEQTIREEFNEFCEVGIHHLLDG